MLNLTLACGHYDRTEALRDGRVQPDGIQLNCLTLKVEETFWRMMQYREFDVAETSLGGYVVRRGRGGRRPGGDSRVPVAVLPAVLHSSFTAAPASTRRKTSRVSASAYPNTR